MRKILILTTLAFVAAVPSFADICGSTPGNLVTNCGFETGDLTGWTLGGNTGFAAVLSGNENSGTYHFDDGAVGSDAILTQTIATTAGQSYEVSFYQADNGGTPNDFSAYFDGVLLYSVVDEAGHGYVFHTFTAVASTASTELRFQFRNDPSFMQLDDTAVAAAVPEPATNVLLLTVLGGVCFVAKRRLQRPTV